MDSAEMHRLLTTVMWDKVKDSVSTSNSVQNFQKSDFFFGASHRIFSNICLEYLKGTCFRTHCAYVHKLPNVNTVQSKVEAANIDDVNEAYKELLLKHDQLLVKYFSVFCSYYGRREKRERLRRMVPIVAKERYIEHSLLKSIVNGIALSGVPHSTAMDIVINEINEIDSIEITDAARFEFMLGIFIDENNTYADENGNDNVLMDHLKCIQKQILDDSIGSHYKAIDKMLQLEQLIDVHEIRKYFVSEIMGKCSINTFRQIDRCLLTKYLKQIEVLGANHVNSIKQKAKIAGMDF